MSRPIGIGEGQTATTRGPLDGSHRRQLVEAGEKSAADAPEVPAGVRRLTASRFVRGAGSDTPEAASVILGGSEVLEVRIPGPMVAERSLVVDASLDPESPTEAPVRVVDWKFLLKVRLT